MAARLNAPEQVAAAWLHDVEDCGITADDLVKAGISQKVVDAVVLLTRAKENAGDGYYGAIRNNTIALAVKVADIEGNTDPKRTARLNPEKRAELADKYEKARRMLGVYVEQHLPS
ncbi:hypothetical protein ABFP37_10410 [Burkholderia sp. RS01]|uniref:hypothetical protein n=1 Tax=unclassified Burkholderia TaxID=2613784 RepID=UPI0032181E50